MKWNSSSSWDAIGFNSEESSVTRVSWRKLQISFISLGTPIETWRRKNIDTRRSTQGDDRWTEEFWEWSLSSRRSSSDDSSRAAVVRSFIARERRGPREREREGWLYAPLRGFFFFFSWVNWRSSIRQFSQIWLLKTTGYESKIIYAFFTFIYFWLHAR